MHSISVSFLRIVDGFGEVGGFLGHFGVGDDGSGLARMEGVSAAAQVQESFDGEADRQQ